MEMEELKSRACLEGITDSLLKQTWEIFDQINKKDGEALKQYFNTQAELLYDRLTKTEVRGYCCPKHGEGDFPIATLLLDFLNANSPTQNLLAAVDSAIAAMRILSAFILGCQFGIVLERSKVIADREIAFLENAWKELVHNPKKPE